MEVKVSHSYDFCPSKNATLFLDICLFLEIWPERTGLKLNMFLPSWSHVSPTFERRNNRKLKSCPVFAVQEHGDSFMVVFQGNKTTRKRQRYIFKSNKIPLIANRIWIICPPSTLGKKWLFKLPYSMSLLKVISTQICCEKSDVMCFWIVRVKTCCIFVHSSINSPINVNSPMHSL